MLERFVTYKVVYCGGTGLYTPHFRLATYTVDTKADKWSPGPDMTKGDAFALVEVYDSDDLAQPPVVTKMVHAVRAADVERAIVLPNPAVFVLQRVDILLTQLEHLRGKTYVLVIFRCAYLQTDNHRCPICFEHEYPALADPMDVYEVEDSDSDSESEPGEELD